MQTSTQIERIKTKEKNRDPLLEGVFQKHLQKRRKKTEKAFL